MTIEGSQDAAPRRAASAWAWWAAARARSSAACTAWRRGWTTATSWSPVRCRPTPRARRRARPSCTSPPSAATPTTATWRASEAAREDGIDVVAIVTPNHLHGRIATAFLDAGIDVICDKPLTTTLAEALELVQRVREQRPPVRADAQLQRLSDGAPGARDGGRRRARRDSRRAGRVPAGLAQHRSRIDRPEAGRMARRPGAGRCGRLARRHRHPCRAPGALHLAASNWRPSVPT